MRSPVPEGAGSGAGAIPARAARRPITLVLVAVAAVLAVIAAVFTVGPASAQPAAAPAVAAAATQPVKIMPLGDSITGSPGCWRALLWQQLENAGYTNIHFVGTLPPPGCGFPYDGDNEGHGGYLATNIANQNLLPGWLNATHPDIVIMHLGTNDVWNNIAPSTILAAFTTLVNQMRASNPNMKILVAQILPMNPTNCSQCAQRVINFNATIPAWAASKTTAQSPIAVVDQWTGFNDATDSIDGVHPNSSGNQKMAAKWFGPLSQAIGSAGKGGGGTPSPSPSTSPSSGGGGSTTGELHAIGAGKCLDDPNWTTTQGTQQDIWSCSGGANQVWTHTANNALSVTVNGQTLCLDAYNNQTTPGTKVEIWACNGGPNQQWSIDPNGTVTGIQSGLCLDVNGASTANGALVQLWNCTSGSNQQWKLGG